MIYLQNLRVTKIHELGTVGNGNNWLKLFKAFFTSFNHRFSTAQKDQQAQKSIKFEFEAVWYSATGWVVVFLLPTEIVNNFAGHLLVE